MANYTIDIYANDRTGAALAGIQSQLDAINRRGRAVIGTIAGLATGNIARGIVNQYTAYERYNNTLRTFLGSQEKATAELQRVRRLANELGQDVDGMTQAFNIFTRFGLDTSNEAMKAFTNIASTTGKSMEQLGEAVADALTGEFERLKEFGIKVSKENGKFVARIGEDQVAIASSTEDLVRQLTNLGNTQFAGSAERQSNSLGGSFTKLVNSIKQASTGLMTGLAPAMKNVTDKITDLINKNQEMIESIGIGAGEAINALVTSVNAIATVVEKLGGFANTISNLAIAAFIARFSKSMFTAAAAGGGLINVFTKITGLFKNVGLALIRMVGLSNPVTAALAAIAFIGMQVAKAFGFDIVEGVKSAIGWFLDLRTRTFEIGGAVATLPEYFRAAFQLIGEQVKTVIDYLKNSFSGNFFDGIESSVKTMYDWFAWGFEQIGVITRKAVNFLANSFIAAGETIINVAKNLPAFFAAAFDAIVKVAADAVLAVGKTFNNMWEAIKLGATGDFTGAMAKLGEDTGYAFTESFASAFADLPSLTSGVDYNAIFGVDRVGQAMDTLARYTGPLRITITKYAQDAMAALGGQVKINQEEAARLAAQLRMLADEDAAMAGEVLNAAAALDTLAESSTKAGEAALSAAAEIAKGLAEEQARFENLNAVLADTSAIENLAKVYGVSADLITRKLREARRGISDFYEQNMTVTDVIRDTWDDMSSGMARGIAEGIMAGKGAFNSFADFLKDFANRVLTQIIEKMLIQPMIDQMSNMFMGTNIAVPTLGQQMGGMFGGGGGGGLLSGLFGGGAGGGGFLSGLFGGVGNFFSGLWGGISNFFGGLFGGFFASGGYLPANKLGVVGEAGPELITGPANITPMGEAGGGALVVNFNINAIDPSTGTQFILEHKQDIEGVIQNAYNRRGKAGIY